MFFYFVFLYHSYWFFQDKYLLHGNYNHKTGGLEVLQVYLNAKSVFDWSYFDVAKDMNGNSYSITKVGADVDCTGAHTDLPCITTETVGININKELLCQNMNGFKLKLYGKHCIVDFCCMTIIALLR